MYNGAYGYNSIGSTIEVGYKRYKGLIGFGSFGDNTVGSEHSIISKWSRVVALRYEYKLSDKNILAPELAFRKSSVIASHSYKDVDSEVLVLLTPGIHYKYDLLGYFPIHGVFGYDLPIGKSSKDFYTDNSFGSIHNLNIGIGLGLKI